MPDAVYCNDGNAVGNGMSSLDSYPGFALALFLGIGVGAFPADSRRIDKQFCAGESHKACSFGVPLVPAYEYAYSAERGFYGLKTEVSGSEIEFFVVCRVVGNVHFSVFAGNRAVCVEYYGGIVVKTRCTAFEEGGYDNCAGLTGEC